MNHRQPFFGLQASLLSKVLTGTAIQKYFQNLEAIRLSRPCNFRYFENMEIKIIVWIIIGLIYIFSRSKEANATSNTDALRPVAMVTGR